MCWQSLTNLLGMLFKIVKDIMVVENSSRNAQDKSYLNHDDLNYLSNLP